MPAYDARAHTHTHTQTHSQQPLVQRWLGLESSTANSFLTLAHPCTSAQKKATFPPNEFAGGGGVVVGGHANSRFNDGRGWALSTVGLTTSLKKKKTGTQMKWNHLIVLRWSKLPFSEILPPIVLMSRTTNIPWSKVVHIAGHWLTKTRHVGMSNEVTSLEIYAGIKHLSFLQFILWSF